MRSHIIEIIKGYNEEKAELTKMWDGAGVGSNTREVIEKRIAEIDKMLNELSKQ